MQKGIDVVWCQVADMGRAVAFYRDVLGFELESESPYWSSFYVSDTMILGLHPLLDPANESPRGRMSGWAVTIVVDDLLSARAAIEAAGAKAHGYDEIEGYALLLTCQDLDGNPFQLAQRGATKASLGVE